MKAGLEDLENIFVKISNIPVTTSIFILLTHISKS